MTHAEQRRLVTWRSKVLQCVGDDVATGESAEQSPAPTVSDQRDAAADDIAPRDTP